VTSLSVAWTGVISSLGGAVDRATINIGKKTRVCAPHRQTLRLFAAYAHKYVNSLPAGYHQTPRISTAAIAEDRSALAVRSFSGADKAHDILHGRRRIAHREYLRILRARIAIRADVCGFARCINAARINARRSAHRASAGMARVKVHQRQRHQRNARMALAVNANISGIAPSRRGRREEMAFGVGRKRRKISNRQHQRRVRARKPGISAVERRWAFHAAPPADAACNPRRSSGLRYWRAGLRPARDRCRWTYIGG